MERGYIKVKAWVIDKQEQVSRRYNMYIDVYSRDESGTIEADENGCYTVWVETVLGETEKAVKVELSTGDIVGSVKGWTCWIPKSQIA